MISPRVTSPVFAWIGSSTTKRRGPNPPKTFVDYFVEALGISPSASTCPFVDGSWSDCARQLDRNTWSRLRASREIEILIREEQVVRRCRVPAQSLQQVIQQSNGKVLGLHCMNGYNQTRSYNLACSGTATEDWLRNSLPFQILAAVNPHYILIQLGGNDLREGMSPYGYGHNIRRIAARCKVVAPGATIVLVGTAINADIRQLDPDWRDYMTELCKIAVDNDDIYYADLRSVDSTPENTADDGIHMNERAARLQGQALLQCLNRG